MVGGRTKPTLKAGVPRVSKPGETPFPAPTPADNESSSYKGDRIIIPLQTAIIVIYYVVCKGLPNKNTIF